MRVLVKLLGFVFCFVFLKSQDGDAAATGNTEEGSYGDVIHFCVSNDKKIDGSSDSHCTETDELSDSVPKCKVITCTAPDISNGEVIEKMQEYQKDAILKYRCSPGFKPREGIPRCAKFGWTLNPECDEVTCELKSTTFGVKKIKPEGKTIFRAGEIVEITCAEKHWFFGTKENIKSFTCGENGQWDYKPVCEEVTCELKSTSFGVKNIKPEGKTIFRAGERVEITCAETYLALFTKENIKSFTCGENGQWDYQPVCAEIRCEVPRDPLVYDPYYYFRGDLKLGAKRDYSCISGYDQMSAEATCTRDGWTPKPLCAVMCAAPNIPNAEIVEDQRTKYIINSRIQYRCNPGFEPEQPVHITCISQTEWTGIQQCTVSEIKCEVPRDQHVNSPELYFSGDMKLGAKKDYYCISGYDQMSAEATCTPDGWTPNPLCAGQ